MSNETNLNDIVCDNLTVGGNKLTGSEFAALDSITAGQVAASKALIVDSNKDLASLRDLTVRQLVNTGGVGAKNGATVSVVEYGDGHVHKTVFTLAATPIVLTDDAGVGQYGGVKIYDFPAGNIVTLGAVIDADITLTETEWTDNAEGDVGLGSAAPTDGDALAGAEQNIIATTAIAALVAQAGPINAQSTGGATLGGAGGTDSDLYLNVRIDDNAAHITGGGTITGTVTVIWMNAGDF